MPSPVGRSVLIYACAFAVAGVTPFLLLPVLTRALTPQQFGEVTSFLVLATMAANVAGLSANGFVAVRYFKASRAEFPRLVGSTVAAVAGAHVVAAVLVALLHPVLRDALGLPFGPSLLAVAAAMVLSINLIWLAVFQSSGEPMLYLGARLVQGAVELSLCLLLLALFVPDASARTDSYAVALSASAAFGAWWCWRRGWLRLAVDRHSLRGLLAFGAPMLPHVVAGSALAYLDRIVVSSVLGAERLGIFMVAMQIGMAVSMLIEPLNKALAPWLFANLAKNDLAVRRMIVRNTYRLYAGLVLVGVAIASIALVFFDVIVGPGYDEARVLIPSMVAGFVLQGMYYGVVNYLFYAERTGRLSMMSATTAVVGCAVSYALTSAYGLVGAGISFAFNNALLFVLVWIAAARTVPMPWLTFRK